MGQTQFDRFQVTRHKLVKMYTEIESLRALVYSTYAQRDAGELELARGRLLKVEGSRVAEEVGREAIQIFGGNGLAKEYLIERLFRDARAMLVEDGSNDTLAIAAGHKIINTYPRMY